LSKRREASPRGFDLDGTALGKLVRERLALGVAGEREQTAVGQAGAVSSRVGLEMDARLKGARQRR
jgi:hypothetical protein